MYTSYRGRSHTKKQRNCKRKISIAERKARARVKEFEKLFPNLVFHAAKKYKSIYQHTISITRKRVAV